jgi:hypothetical protein
MALSVGARDGVVVAFAMWEGTMFMGNPVESGKGLARSDAL